MAGDTIEQHSLMGVGHRDLDSRGGGSSLYCISVKRVTLR